MNTPNSRLLPGREALSARAAGWATLFHRIVRLEARAIDGHRASLRERWQVLRRTRRPGEALRYQIDLMPRTVQQLNADHRRRLVVLRALFRSPKTPSTLPDARP